MKKLICAADIEALAHAGEQTLIVDDNTIVTPQAADVAKKFHISIEKGNTASCPSATCGQEKLSLDADSIYAVLLEMQKKGMLTDSFFNNFPVKGYQAEKDSSGLKIVQGQSVEFQAFYPDQPQSDVAIREVLEKDEARIRSGYMTLGHSPYEQKHTCEATFYVVSGSVDITCNHRTFTAHAGDSVYVPEGFNSVWKAHGQAKLFYTRYPQ